MATRLEFHEKLRQVFVRVRDDAEKHVYFQPPETFKMVYPCIVYEMSRDDLLHADDTAYRRKKAYTVTIIDKNPDSELPDLLSDIFNVPMNRHFTSDNLHHFVYTIFQ